MPLYASLLSLPLTADYAPWHMSPEQHKQKTLQAILTTLLRLAAQQPVLFVMEDLHWVDPSTLEFLSLLVDQGPTARILASCTFRPDFSPPWTGRSHLTQVALHRLTRPQAVELSRQVAHGKALPPEVIEQIVAKTDGVPLFVEELTKMVLESDLLQERDDRYTLTGPLPPLAIPTTLHELLAHHYTEAGLAAHAIPYWQQAGQRASARSAHVEAIGHLTKGLDVLQVLPETSERAQHELDLQIALGRALTATKGQAAPEVGQVFTRARELCQQVEGTPPLFRVLNGLHNFHIVRAELQTARALSEELLTLA